MVRTSISALGWDLTHATTIKKPLPMIILIISAGFLTLLGNAIVAAPTVADFAELPMFGDLKISPDGRFLAARVNNHNIYTVAIFDITAPIFRHPAVDIASIYVDYDTGKLDHINFVEDSVKTKYFSRKPIEDDIMDGVNWLIKNEYTNPDRIAIMGGSYGGYAALMGAVKTPDLYKCSVSFAGVTDLPDLLVRERKFIGGIYATRFIGNLWKDRRMLAENSPARRAKDITIPVLLFHGDEDITVDMEQSVKMAKALKKHRKEYEFIRLKNGDHHLSLYLNRLKFLTTTGKFLADCLD